MSVAYTLYFNRASLPSFAAVREVARHLESDFDFSAPFDFTVADAYCPCSLAGEECGFQWRLTAADGQTEAYGKDSRAMLGTLSAFDEMLLRSEHFYAYHPHVWAAAHENGACAVIVAAAFALLSDATLVAPDTSVVKGDELPDWSVGEVMAHLDGWDVATKRGDKPYPAEELLMEWLNALENAAVRLLPLMNPASSRITLLFSTGLRLSGARWTVTAGGETHSTVDYPSGALSEAQRQTLRRAFTPLASLVENSALQQVRFDARTLELAVVFPDGILTFAPQAQGADTPELPLPGDRWEMIDSGLVTVSPDTLVEKLAIIRY